MSPFCIYDLGFRDRKLQLGQAVVSTCPWAQVCPPLRSLWTQVLSSEKKLDFVAAVFVLK